MQSNQWQFSDMLTINTLVDCGTFSVDFFYGDDYQSLIDTDIFDIITDSVDPQDMNSFNILEL